MIAQGIVKNNQKRTRKQGARNWSHALIIFAKDSVETWVSPFSLLQDALVAVERLSATTLTKHSHVNLPLIF